MNREHIDTMLDALRACIGGDQAPNVRIETYTERTLYADGTATSRAIGGRVLIEWGEQSDRRVDHD